VAWVAIDDRRLACAYYTGLVFIICYLVWGVVFDRGYLELDPVQGVCRPHLERRLGPNASLCSATPCGRIPTADVQAGVSVGQVFVATHVREVLERCSDMYCVEPQEVVKVKEFYAQGVESYVLSAECSAQAFKFFSEDCSNQELMAQVQPKLRGSADGVGTLASNACPFTTSNMRAQGRLLGPGGQVVKDVPPGTEDTFSLGTWLRAAGTQLGGASDAPNAFEGATFRREGLVLVVTFAYHNQPEHDSLWEYLALPKRNAIQYDIKVQRVAEADYHVHRSTVHESTGWRESRTSHGLLVRFVQTGQLGRFSYAALADQIVLKMGMLTLLQLSLDLFWQYVLPRFGVDYTNQVYSWVVKTTSVEPTTKAV